MGVLEEEQVVVAAPPALQAPLQLEGVTEAHRAEPSNPEHRRRRYRRLAPTPAGVAGDPSQGGQTSTDQSLVSTISLTRATKAAA